MEKVGFRSAALRRRIARDEREASLISIFDRPKFPILAHPAFYELDFLVVRRKAMPIVLESESHIMRFRQIVALGAIVGGFGASDLPGARAQSVNSQVRLVRMLLLKESRDIVSESAQSTRFFSTQLQIVQLSQRLATDTSRQFRRDIRLLSGFETKAAQILGTGRVLAVKLSAEDVQTLRTVASLPATTSNLSLYTFQADSNHRTITAILNSPPFGITPVSPSA